MPRPFGNVPQPASNHTWPVGETRNTALADALPSKLACIPSSVICRFRRSTPVAIRAIAPIWTSKPETAVRVRGRIAWILDGAKARGFWAGEDPARWREASSESHTPRNQKSARHPCPSLKGPDFLRRVAGRPGIAARLLMFHGLDGCAHRRGARRPVVRVRPRCPPSDTVSGLDER